MIIFRAMQRLHRDRRGAAAIEYAIVSPVFLFLLFSIIEMGMIMLSATAIESATSIAARTARIGDDGGTGDLVSFIREEVRARSWGMVNADKILITTDLVTSYDDIPKPEQCLATPTPPIGTCPAGEPYIDANGDGKYNGMPPLDLGTSSEIVRLRVYYPAHIFSPLTGALMEQTAEGEYLISSTTMVKNEPY